MKDNLPIITCPCCGQQYMPGEIFMPKAFFGNQKDIMKDSSGKIEFYLGDDMDLDEEFVCENCLSKLKIHANLTYNITLGDKDDFDDEYSTTISKPEKIKLEETELFND